MKNYEIVTINKDDSIERMTLRSAWAAEKYMEAQRKKKTTKQVSCYSTGGQL